VEQQQVLNETLDQRTMLKSYYLAQESDSINFLNHVETLARDLGVSLKTNNLDTVSIDDRTWITTSFSFSGREGDVKKFVSVLETLPYVLELTSVNLETESGGNWSSEVALRVRVL
jgi:ACT domain-containing protein